MKRIRKTQATLNLPSLTLEGSLFLPGQLEKAAQGRAKEGQTEADYAIPKGVRLKDEYSRAFQIACAQWQHFSAQMERNDVDAAQLTTAFVHELLRDALQGMNSPGANQALTEMLRDLNALLDKHSRGEDTTEDFAEFMNRHGEMFPENPQTVEELIDALARQAAAGQRLLNSMSPQQREELAGLMAQALGDGELAAQLAALTDALRGLRPDLGWNGSEPSRGRNPLGYGEATEALAELADLDDLMRLYSHPALPSLMFSAGEPPIT